MDSASDRQYRVALVGGAGSWGRLYVQAFAEHPRTEIVALADRSLDRRQAVADHYGIPTVVDDVEDLLAVEVPDIVSVILPVEVSPQVVVACAEAGAEAISTINTLEALDIDPDLERPVLGNCYGGLSGRAIRPIALRKVAECRMALDEAGHASVPVIAIGGAATGRDLARFILVGAHGVQMGTAARNDHQVFSRAVEELGAWMAGKGYRRLEDFRGQALEWLR